MPRRFGSFGWGAAALSLVLAAPAWAHSISTDGAAGGIPIPALTHGQMAVVGGYQPAILDLADRVERTDPVFRRLANFVALQRTYCLWGVVPGSVTDEDSPFNECSHASLASMLALLLHMRGMAGADPDIGRLVDRIDSAMLEQGTALALCRYSTESFNTAQVIRPNWSAFPSHPPSLLSATAVLLACLAGFGLLRGGRAAGRAGTSALRKETSP